MQVFTCLLQRSIGKSILACQASCRTFLRCGTRNATRPSRAEPLVELARYHRVRAGYAVAMLFARHAAVVPHPTDLLFVDEAAYAWRALDELSIAAFYAGHIEEGRAAADQLLQEALFPSSERVRMLANRAFYQ